MSLHFLMEQLSHSTSLGPFSSDNADLAMAVSNARWRQDYVRTHVTRTTYCVRLFSPSNRNSLWRSRFPAGGKVIFVVATQTKDFWLAFQSLPTFGPAHRARADAGSAAPSISLLSLRSDFLSAAFSGIYAYNDWSNCCNVSFLICSGRNCHHFPPSVAICQHQKGMITPIAFWRLQP